MERLCEGQILAMANDFDTKPDRARWVSPEVVAAAILDLRDARAEIKRLKDEINLRATPQGEEK